MKFRHAGNDDLPAIMELEQQQPFPANKESLRNLFRHSHHIHVLLNDDKVVAFVAFRVMKRNVILVKLAGKGYEDEVLKRLEEKADERRWFFLWLIPERDRESMDRAVELGFEFLGLQKDPDGLEDRLRYYRNIRSFAPGEECEA